LRQRARAGGPADQAGAVRALEWVVCPAAVAEAPAAFPGVVAAPTLQVQAGARVKAAEVCGNPAAGAERSAAPVAVVEQEPVQASVVEEPRLRVELEQLRRESGTPLQLCCVVPVEAEVQVQARVEVEASAPLPEGFRVEAVGPAAALLWKKKVCVPCSGSLRSSANQEKIPNRGWMCRHFNLG